jgi:hypothetical protein
VAYVERDGTQDTLHLEQQSGDALTSLPALGEPGIIHQPAIAADSKGMHIV